MKSTKPNATEIANAALDAVLAIVRTVEYDKNSFTAQELAKKEGISVRTMQKRVGDKVKEGLLVRTWKRVDGKTVPSYRAK